MTNDASVSLEIYVNGPDIMRGELGEMDFLFLSTHFAIFVTRKWMAELQRSPEEENKGLDLSRALHISSMLSLKVSYRDGGPRGSFGKNSTSIST